MRCRGIILFALLTCLLAVAVTAFVTRKTTVLRLARRPSDLAIDRDVVYRAGSAKPKHRLDVFAPKNAHGAPVVHFVHGGYWVGGDKDEIPVVSS